MAKAAALTTAGALGLWAALDIPHSTADPPIGGTPTVYRTVTETVTRKLEGRGIWWWRDRAIRNRKALNGTRITLQRIRAVTQARWQPTVDYAIDLASRVFNIDETKMRTVAWCESTMRPWATNGRYRGLFQLGWAPFGLDPYDPVANALSAAQTVARDGSWRQWECG
jgi:hypothetical protein